MRTVTINALTEAEAIVICLDENGWSPDAVRQVDSGNEGENAWMCFESASDAETWDRQI